MAKQKINIKDVAAAANVHPSTVSRVLNPATRSMVSTDVADRVTRIADKMGYSRSPVASSLRTGKSYTIGVIIPDLSNPVFPPVVRGIERTLGAEGYIALLADSDNNPKSERAIFDSMKARNIDGLIMATAHTEDPIVDACINENVPVVLVNRTVDSHQVTAVINNDELGIQMAVAHLVELGHEKIAFLGGPKNTSTGRDRRQAFETQGQSGSFDFDRKLLKSCDTFSEKAGFGGTIELLDTGRLFTAIVAANDMLAIGCYDALRERGLVCPDDISVTGFNDMPFVDRLSPPLTTLHIPHDELGVQAANCLLAAIRDPDSTARTVRLNPELVVRGSSDAPTDRR
jgi:LacI family transcriptional regulator